MTNTELLNNSTVPGPGSFALLARALGLLGLTAASGVIGVRGADAAPIRQPLPYGPFGDCS